MLATPRGGEQKSYEANGRHKEERRLREHIAQNYPHEAEERRMQLLGQLRQGDDQGPAVYRGDQSSQTRARERTPFVLVQQATHAPSTLPNNLFQIASLCRVEPNFADAAMLVYLYVYV